MGKIFFTSDQHFNHTNIINFCKRPFLTIEEMNATMITNWNKTVKTADTVYCLGDLILSKDKSFNSPENILKLLNSLNGTKHLIIGNHDNKNVINCPAWKSTSYLNQVSINGQLIVMCHYSMSVWDQSHRNSWHLYGHSHGTLPENPQKLSCDVGVDCWNFIPVAFEIIEYKMMQRIKNKTPRTIESDIQWQVQQDKTLKENQQNNKQIIEEFSK